MITKTRNCPPRPLYIILTYTYFQWSISTTVVPSLMDWPFVCIKRKAGEVSRYSVTPHQGHSLWFPGSGLSPFKEHRALECTLGNSFIKELSSTQESEPWISLEKESFENLSPNLRFRPDSLWILYMEVDTQNKQFSISSWNSSVLLRFSF